MMKRFLSLVIDTTFNWYDLWLIDTSELSGISSVFLGPCMFFFTKEKEAFSWFAVEISIGNSGLENFKNLGVGMESTICNRFKHHHQELICVRHLKKCDKENKFLSCNRKQTNHLHKSLLKSWCSKLCLQWKSRNLLRVWLCRVVQYG